MLKKLDLFGYRSLFVLLMATIEVKYIFKPQTPSAVWELAWVVTFYFIGRIFLEFVVVPLIERYYPDPRES